MIHAVPQLPFRMSVCGRSDMNRFAADSVTHILSIDNPESLTPTPPWFAGVHWHTLFHDVDTTYGIEGTSVIAPTQDEVRRILAFGRTCQEASRSQSVHLLIHCTAGISRSPAAAYGILCQALGQGREGEALQHLLSIKADVYPNKLVVQHADELLSRSGRMLAIIHSLRNDFD
jgi:predicted protein tyrosine phosphatase